ncbi:MAG: lipocalin-like domain-containing protein [Gemmatimonadota bacterium]|nr:lipocalin-like domain-containing protein [Gemmatimonadota bacterium]MDQ8173175.1 lipocalin-like domain-containing protein [Gemmatimonadota bacterium]
MPSRRFRWSSAWPVPSLIVASLLALLAIVPSAGAQAPIGTWTLVSRTDSSAAGVQPADGPLGADPIAWISYDAQGHVAAQLMARDRTRGPVVPTPPALRDPNNSAASDGYDAYFGTYVIDAAAGIVRHQLLGALSPADVGRTLQRHFLLRGDTLLIWFDARHTDGAAVTRRLLWRRLGS